MTFTYFQARTEGLIINVPELLLAWRGVGTLRGGGGTDVRQISHLGYRETSGEETNFIKPENSSQSFPYCPTPSHPISILLLWLSKSLFMEHDGWEKTYAKLIQKFVHILVGVSTENACVKKKKKKTQLVWSWSWLRVKMETIKQSGNIVFHFSTSILLQCVYSSTVSASFNGLKKKKKENRITKQICICAFYVTLLQHRVPCRDDGLTSYPPQQEQEHSPAGLPLLSFHSFPLSISYHLFLSCTKPDEGHLTNVPIAMQKSNILAAPWPVNILTSQSWQDLPLLSATRWLPWL